MNDRPQIFKYENYRLYLKDTFTVLKNKNKKFSLRFFARQAGFRSHNTLWNVVTNRNNLSNDAIEKICKALKLSRAEASYFKLLVQTNQAKNSEEKRRLFEEILRSKAYHKAHPLSEAQYRYYTDWYMVVIRELVALPNFKEDSQWIAAQVWPNITPKQAQQAIDELFKLNLITRAPNGHLMQTHGIVETPQEVNSALIAQFHREFLKKASESIDIVSRELRDISSITFTVSAGVATALKEKIQNFRKELLAEAARDPNPDVAYQLNFQLFPVSQWPTSGSSQGGSES